MLFPNELEDETLYSLISRIAIVNGLSPSTLNLFESISHPTRAADRKINLEDLSNFSHGLYGTRETLSSRYTSRYASPEDKCSLIGLSNKHRNIWRWCEKCSKDELNTVGIAYWHLLHQLPCVLACDKHQKPLWEVNIPFRERQSKFILPKHAKKLDYYQACNEERLNTAIALTHIERRLSIESLEFNPAILEGMFDMKLRHENWSNPLRHTISVISNGNQYIELNINRLVSAKNPPVEYLAALIHSAYGNYDLFLNHYTWNIAICHGATLPPRPTTSGKKDKHRQSCYEYLKSTTDKSRTGFWKHNPSGARWLLRYDSDWLNTNLPSFSESSAESKLSQLRLFT